MDLTKPSNAPSDLEKLRADIDTLAIAFERMLQFLQSHYPRMDGHLHDYALRQSVNDLGRLVHEARLRRREKGIR